MSCKSRKQSEGQPFPVSSSHTIRVDTILPESLKTEESRVFSYKLTTLERSGRALVQHGNAPNYQGDKIGNNSGNELFYLMKIAAMCDDFAELWNSNLLPDRDAKSASTSIYGDVYVPRSVSASEHPHDPIFYQEPIMGHKHHQNEQDNEWHKDIDFWRPDLKKKRRRPASKPKVHKLLIGESGKSFVWRRPKYRYAGGHPRQQFPSLRCFLQKLEHV